MEIYSTEIVHLDEGGWVWRIKYSDGSMKAGDAATWEEAVKIVDKIEDEAQKDGAC